MTGPFVLVGLLVFAGVVAWIGDRWLQHLEASDYPEVGELLRMPRVTEREKREALAVLDRELRVRVRPALYDWCKKCGARGPGVILDVHHLTYERLGDELPTDLIVLCRGCHQVEHYEGSD